MRSILMSLVLVFVGANHAAAQAPRDVLLDVCNDTGVSVAVAAAYGTDPTSARVLRSWFLVQPSACLEGALNNVVGETIDIHVMSGEFRWPAGAGDHQYCVPASTYFGAAVQAPCRISGQQLRHFRQVSVRATRLRDRNGSNIGRASYRIDCGALDAENVALCRRAPADDRGLAQPVRELEYCNNNPRPIGVTAFADEHGDFHEANQWRQLAPDGCSVIYRGFPQDNAVLIVLDDGKTNGGDGHICMNETGIGGANSRMLVHEDAACPPSLAVRRVYRRLQFGAYTHHHTAYVNWE
jgi:uncharacterized membrane protein